MKRMRVLGLCLLAVGAISAVIVASASAVAVPEFGRCKAAKGTGKFKNSGCTLLAKALVEEKKFEWFGGPGPKNKFKAHQKPETLATLETVGGTKITCTTESNENAEFNSAKTVAKIIAEFKGCETSKIPCNSAGKGTGEITTFALAGKLGVEKLFVKEGKIEEAKNKLEVQLFAETPGGLLAEFNCSTIHVEVRGCVAHPVASGKMLLTSTEKFTASKGEQKPDKFLGGPVDECALESNGGAGFEEAGQTITAIVEGEEKLEANPKPEGE
jgi:hypothetical protein